MTQPLTSIEGDRYSTMDNVDGKQARRTAQSSGLGELFEYVLNPVVLGGASITHASSHQPWNRFLELHIG